ncbi:hemolysin family protein [Xiashengella succiniciproducens]|jgi:CBS domain containing-hemolysin-like protein|uniref:Hemolysin family protein n=1 Tax=Xiashengella succiniciproducens TaxID=2949635 RepID=A0A9J6ZS37_9BACT|nr:hemolysin family protein [Alkaliflexus sp. Ai-910]URW80422.1 hemolysin family protein [Alkaliflexus sp. Ai-910]
MSHIAVMLVALLISSILSGSEMALLASNKLMIELNRQKYPSYSKVTDIFYNNRHLFVTTVFAGNVIALATFTISLVFYTGPELIHLTDSLLLVAIIQVLLATLVFMLFSRVLPKLIFRLNPSRSLNIISVPLLGIYAILYPIAKPLSGFTDFLYRKIRKNGNNGPVPVPERISLDHLLIDSSGNEEKPEPEPEEVKFFRNALDFSSIKIRECYVPRTDLEAVEISDDIETLRKMFIETGFSKILVYRETIDNIVGYVHLSALFNNPDSVQSVITPISVVPESMTANKLLEIFTKEHKSIALVVDEFGGTSGIVTLEDILEEIFGEINDEHDVSDLTEVKIFDNTYKFSARAEIDYLNEKYNLNLPVSDDYETIAGLILSHSESIPGVGEEIIIDNISIKILEASKSRIDLVQITILPV